MKTQNHFHFPEGHNQVWVDTSYCDAQFNIGEKIVIEGEPTVFVVTDIQNPVFAGCQTRGAGESVKMIMRNVILAAAALTDQE